MAKKKGKKHSPYFWLVSVIIPLVAFIAGNLTPSIGTLNNNGVKFLGYKFSTFEFSDGRFDTEFWYPQNHTRVISISNKAGFGLKPYLVMELIPYDSEIQIKCHQQISKEDCFEGFILSDIATLQFDIEVGKPSQKNYRLCLRVVDDRTNKQNNYRENCYDLLMKEKPK